jgi:hypothetical protein
VSIASVLDAIRQIRADGAQVYVEGDAVLVRGTPQQRERATCALRDYDFEEIAEGLATMDAPAAPKGGRPPKYRTDGERSEARRHQNRIRQQNFRQRRSVTHNAKPPWALNV